MLISIVIPVLNEEKFLRGCLESLTYQDHAGSFEIIVADNGSADKSVSIAREFGARIIHCPEKKSVFYAREKGADAARGDIIIQADADTLYPRDWLKKIARKFADHPEAVVVAGRFLYRDPPRLAKFEYACRDFVNRFGSIVFRRPLAVSGATYAFRRQPFLAAGGYRGLTYSADQYSLTGRLKKMGRILYDRNVFVLTSARTVRRPRKQVFATGFSQFLDWVRFLATCLVDNIKGFATRTRSRRVATRISPLAISLLALFAYGYYSPSAQVFGKVYSKAPVAQNAVALTFDDGPNEPYTSEVLDILQKYDVRATFFEIGKNVGLYPDVAQRLIAGGNVVGNHSFSHKANHALSPYGAQDVARAESTIFNLLGVAPHLYRPPHGKRSPWEVRSVAKTGLIEITWSVTSSDNKAGDLIAQDIIHKTHPGDIILLHDGYGTEHYNQHANKSTVVAALPKIIEQLQAKGYRFVTVPELLNVPAYNQESVPSR